MPARGLDPGMRTVVRDRWLLAGLAVIIVQLAIGPMIQNLADAISAAMAVLAIICLARTVRLMPKAGAPDRWRWQATAAAWAFWSLQWITNAVQNSLLGGDQFWTKVFAEARLAALIVALVPLAAATDDRRLRWLDALFGLTFATLMTLLSWPDLLDAAARGPNTGYLYLGYVAMAGFAGLSYLSQSDPPMRRVAGALFVTLCAYAVTGVSARELIGRGWLSMNSPVFAYGDLAFIAYLVVIGRSARPGAARTDAALDHRRVLLGRLVPLALTIFIVALSFTVTRTMPSAAVIAGVVGLAILIAYAARTALTETLHHRRQEAALARESARSAGLADLMHELRSPLGAIALNADILQRGSSLTAAERRVCSAIETGCMGIARLLDDVLALERLEAGLERPTLASCDLQPLVRDCVALLDAQAAEFGVALDAQTVSVRCIVDDQAVRRILVNLVTNALRFTPRGGRVALSLRATAEGCAIAVADTGVGLSSEVRAGLFRRFSTAGRPVNGRRGSGLGLAISLALARSMDGTIEVAPDAGAGTTFTLRLPFRPAGTPGG